MDVVKGLGESMRGQWSGDVDMNDGHLVGLYQEYKHRLKKATDIGLGERGTLQLIEVDLNAALEELTKDLTFVHSGKLLLYSMHVHTLHMYM